MKSIIAIFVLSLTLNGCGVMKGQGTVWETVHINYEGGENDVLELNVDFIEQCPDKVKTIIAFYAKHYLTADNYMFDAAANDSRLTGALGGYSSLQEAQDDLLKGNERSFSEFSRRASQDDPTPGIMKIEYGGTAATVHLSGVWGRPIRTDEFGITLGGKIKYIQR